MYEVSMIKKINLIGYDRIKNLRLFTDFGNGISFNVKLISGFKGSFSYNLNRLGGIKTRRGYIGLHFNSTCFCNKEFIDIFVIYKDRNSKLDKSKYICSVCPESEFNVTVKRERGKNRFVVRTNSPHKTLTLRINSLEEFDGVFYNMIPDVAVKDKVKFEFNIKKI